MSLIVDDIFNSVQGEGYDAGFNTTFLRLYGCNLKCSFCDQPQIRKNAKKMSVENVVGKIRSFHCDRVCITGGEPLLQPEVFCVIYDLLTCNYKVSIETNGAVPIDDVAYARSYRYIMDIKCPSSGMSNKNLYCNLDNLKSCDEVKFVISDDFDYAFMKNIIRKYPTKAKLLVSPIMIQRPDGSWYSEVAPYLGEWLHKDRLDYIRVQCQLHKFLGVK